MGIHVIALDIGTTHIKSALFNEQGEAVEIKKEATPLQRKDDIEIYGASEIWGLVETQIKELIKACQGDVTGISITGMAEAGLILDKRTGKELTEILPWFAPYTEELAKQMPEEKADQVFRKSGLRNSYKYGIYKYIWLLKEKNLKKEHTIWLSVCDYIAYKLTGKFATDPTFAARTYVYHVPMQRWDEERIEEYGLKYDNFPVIYESGKTIGKYGEIPVAIAGHDHLCAAFGLLYYENDAICDSAGTSETYVGIMEQVPKKDGFSEKTGFLYGPFVSGGYFYMANVPSSGHSVEWFRKKLQIETLSYEKMNKSLLKLDENPSGLLYFPYLTGMGTPWYDADMRGMLIGLREDQDGIVILKGILEGIQYQAKWVLEELKKHHKVCASKIICAGGSTHNEIMMKTKANVLEKPVYVTKMTEATMYGAAALFLLKNEMETVAFKFLEQVQVEQKVYNPKHEISKLYENIFQKKYKPFIDLIYNEKNVRKEEEHE